MTRALISLAIAAAAGAACSTGPAPPALTSGALRGANVLLVTIDTLRRDRLGAYGSAAGLTPTLDRLAAAGVRYARAYSHVPMTLPAHTSILTGLTPRRHGVHNNVAFRLDDGVPTIATMLKSVGYRTGAFVGAFILDARFGLSRSFDVYDDHFPQPTGALMFGSTERTAAEVVAAAGDWILSTSATTGQRASGTASAYAHPWFAWVHLFDPHAPYQAPPAYRAGRSPYDAEVAYTDATLGQFLDRLRAAHALDRTLIVVTGDHGESLGEHGEATHGLFAYDATLAVPLIVSGPSIAPRIVDTPAAHVDILPTIADLTGVPASSAVDGRSLAASPSDRAIYFEALDAQLTRDWAPLTGIVRGDWKLIDLPVLELYNLRTDPHEQTNVADRESSRIAPLANLLADVTAGPATKARPSMVDADAAARLRALGYTGGSPATRARPYKDADDPKRLVALNEQFNAALAAFNDGRRDDALAAFQALLTERPDFITARTGAATVLLSEQRAAEAVRLLEAAPATQAAASPELLAKLGAALSEAGDIPKAAVAFERSRAMGNQNPELMNDLGVVYGRLGRAVEARAQFRELLGHAPNAAGAWNNLGVLELSTGHLDAAADAFRRAVQADPSMGDAWQGLGAATVDRDRTAAIDAWRHAERLRPRDYDLLFNLGMVLAESSVPGDALPYLDRFAREAPRARYAGDLTRVRARIAKVRQ